MFILRKELDAFFQSAGKIEAFPALPVAEIFHAPRPLPVPGKEPDKQVVSPKQVKFPLHFSGNHANQYGIGPDGTSGFVQRILHDASQLRGEVGLASL
jgi:hypothetical protein